MRHEIGKGRAFAVCLAATALFTGAAKADVVYTVTATGTIQSGYDYGAFNSPRHHLAGKSYTIFETYDARRQRLGDGQ